MEAWNTLLSEDEHQDTGVCGAVRHSGAFGNYSLYHTANVLNHLSLLAAHHCGRCWPMASGGEF